MEAIDEYFPFLSFDAPFGYVQERLDTINNIPATVMKGVLNKNTLHRFLKEADLADLLGRIESSFVLLRLPC